MKKINTEKHKMKTVGFKFKVEPSQWVNQTAHANFTLEIIERIKISKN